MKTKNKLIIMITGASGGLGRELAIQLAKKGHNVFACTRYPYNIKVFLKRKNLFLRNLIPLELDLVKPKSVKIACDYILKKEGGIDILVNNAGYGLIGSVESLSPTQLKKLFAVNLFGAIWCLQAVLPLMRKQGSGLIVNISSVSGLIGSPLLGGYCASKFALEGLSECLAMELEKYHVKVKVVEPGLLESSFIKNIEIGSRLKPNDNPYLFETRESVKKMQELLASKKAEKLADVAKIIVRAIEDNQKTFRIRTGDWAKKVVARKLKEPVLLISK